MEDEHIWEPVSENLEQILMSNEFRIKKTPKKLDSVDLAIQHAGFKTDNKRIKNMFIKMIKNLPEYEFATIITNYREQKMNNEFIGDWNPFYIKTKNDLIKEIKRLSFRFRGDPITLQLLKDVLKIDFVIIRKKRIEEIKNPENTRFIILVYNVEKQEETHNVNETYQIVGFKPLRHQKTKSIFKKDSIPMEINRVLSIDDAFSFHIQQVCAQQQNNCKIKSLHTIVSEIEQRMGGSIDLTMRKKLIQVLYTWIKNNNYLETVKNK
jgi:hypothetical protein